MAHVVTPGSLDSHMEEPQAASGTSREPTAPQVDKKKVTKSVGGASANSTLPDTEAEAGPSGPINRGKTWPLQGFTHEASGTIDGPDIFDWANGEDNINSSWARKIILSFG